MSTSNFRHDIPALLADPCPADWHKVCLILDKIHKAKPGGSIALGEAVALVKKCLRKWNAAALKAVPRDPLAHWSRSNVGQGCLLDLCLSVRETQTYSYFETYVCNDPQLLWEDGPWGKLKGCQQVHLARAFTGGVQRVEGDWIRTGERGQGDLVGWFSLWLPPYGVVAMRVELEIKMPTGRLSPSQIARRAKLARAGGCYLVAKSVKSAVLQLVTVRETLRAGGTVAEAGVRIEGLGW